MDWFYRVVFTFAETDSELLSILVELTFWSTSEPEGKSLRTPGDYCWLSISKFWSCFCMENDCAWSL